MLGEGRGKQGKGTEGARGSNGRKRQGRSFPPANRVRRLVARPSVLPRTISRDLFLVGPRVTQMMLPGFSGGPIKHPMVRTLTQP